MDKAYVRLVGQPSPSHLDLNTIKAMLDPIGPTEALAVGQTSTNRTKYLDVDKWIKSAIHEASLLRLPDYPLSILDIGTGPGYLPLVCKTLGHRCIGLDRPQMFFAAMRKWTGTETVIHKIEPLKPLPAFRQPFDMVTTLRTPFNTVWAERRLFTIDEWSYLLDEIKKLLKPNGSFSLRMNRKYEYVGLVYGSPELMKLFEARGGSFEPSRAIRFAPLL